MVHFKNRFLDAYDAKSTAGYRNASLSVVLVDAVTSSLGVESHVCELQLGIAEVEAVKHGLGSSGSGHQRYITFRNLRAI